MTCPFDPKPDGPRYAGCGDAVTAHVAQWVGERIVAAECSAEPKGDG